MNFKRRVYKRQAMELAALFGIRLRKTLQGHSTSIIVPLCFTIYEIAKFCAIDSNLVM